MKYLLFATCLLLAGCAYAQEPTYTPMKGAYKYKAIKLDTLFLIPAFADTIAANATYLDAVPGSMIRCGNDFWMRNANASAWLQNVNVGSGANPSIQYVDSIYRKTGKDSIYWRKGGVTSQIKDSIGKTVAVDTIYRTAGKDSIFFKINGVTYRIKDSTGRTDSPDRINGTATKTVISQFNDTVGMYFKKVDTFHVDAVYAEMGFGDSVKLSAGTLMLDGTLRHRTPANNADAYYHANNYGLTGYFKITYSEDIDLNASSYNVYLPGVYKIVDYTSNNALNLPDAGNWTGQTFTFINDSGSNIDGPDITATSGTVYDGANGTITTFTNGKIMTCYCNGANYYCTFY